MKKTILSTALLAALGVSGLATMSAQAANVNTGDQLTITTGTGFDANGNVTATVGGSWFGMDTNGNGAIANGEKHQLAQGTTGLVIGVTTPVGSYHTLAPTAGDTNAITAPWSFFGNTGSDYVTTAVTGGTVTGLTLSGWTVAWNTVPAINMGGGAWGTGFSSGIGNFAWDGVSGHAYTLDYTATVPNDGSTNFGNVRYQLHLEGVVNTVPIPAAVWLLGSGLVGLVGVARRRKTSV